MSKENERITDAELGRLLQAFDPVPRPPHALLAALESDILERTEHLPQDRPPDFAVPAWIPPQARTPRAAAMASVLIVMLGFLIGQVSFGRGDAPYLAAGTSVLALADDASTDTSWGDADDDAE